MFLTTNYPADFLLKVKPASTYLVNPLWEEGTDYMTSEYWNDGRSIKEIRQRMSPTVEENPDCGEIWTVPDDFRCKNTCQNAKTICLYDFHSHGKKCFCLGSKIKGKI